MMAPENGFVVETKTEQQRAEAEKIKKIKKN